MLELDREAERLQDEINQGKGYQGKKRGKQQTLKEETREVVVSTTDPDSGYMSRNVLEHCLLSALVSNIKRYLKALKNKAQQHKVACLITKSLQRLRKWLGNKFPSHFCQQAHLHPFLLMYASMGVIFSGFKPGKRAYNAVKITAVALCGKCPEIKTMPALTAIGWAKPKGNRNCPIVTCINIRRQAITKLGITRTPKITVSCIT